MADKKKFDWIKFLGLVFQFVITIIKFFVDDDEDEVKE